MSQNHQKIFFRSLDYDLCEAVHQIFPAKALTIRLSISVLLGLVLLSNFEHISWGVICNTFTLPFSLFIYCAYLVSWYQSHLIFTLQAP